MANRYLVDTCVFARWYLKQDGYREARVIRQEYQVGRVELETVDFVRYELGQVLRKLGLLKSLISKEEFIAAACSIDDTGIPIHVTDGQLMEQAATLASERMVAFFDALLIAWSLELNLTVLTTDKRLYGAAGDIAQIKLLIG